MNKDLRILVVDDDPMAILHLLKFLNAIPYVQTEVADRVTELDKLLDAARFDLAFLDTGFGGQEKGLAQAQKITSKNIPIIFTSGSENEPVFERARKFAPVLYLIKPYRTQTLRRSAGLLIEQLFKKDHDKIVDAADPFLIIKDRLFIKVGNQLQMLLIDDIRWLRSEGNYCTIHTCQKKFVVKLSLTKILDLLQGHGFFRIHKQYLISLKSITSIDTVHNRVELDEQIIPVGNSYRYDLLNNIRRL